MGKPWSSRSFQAQCFTWAEILGQIQSKKTPDAYEVESERSGILRDTDEDRTISFMFLFKFFQLQ